MRIRTATDADRASIYRIRHDVYASELGQHPPSDEGLLSDPLDAVNDYLVALEGGQIAGFVSITGPQAGAYSIDKYFAREMLPIAFDDGLYEVRILTVAGDHRGSPVALALAYGALRFIEQRGGSHVVAVGRVDLLPFYRKLGLIALDMRVSAGDVEFELMHAAVSVLRRRATSLGEQLARMHETVEWELPMPFDPEERCDHGGASIAVVGDRFEHLERRDSVIAADVLDAWFPPSPRVLAELSTGLEWLARTAPPVTATGLIATIGETRGIDPDAIVVGAGSSDLIYRHIARWFSSSSRALVLDPSYGEYAYVLEHVVGCTVDRVTLRRSDDFEPDIEALVARIAGGAYDLVVIVNPNNPTGRLIPRARLARVFTTAPSTTRFWIDEAYIDFAGREHSVESIAATTANVVVCKSLSKAYALSGFRAAYLCASHAIVRDARRATPPWPVGLAAQVAAVAALGDGEYYRARYEETAALRLELAEMLRSAMPSIDVIAGRINALLLELPADGPGAGVVARRCAARGVHVRDISSMGRSTGSRLLRVAVRDAASNARIVETLASALGDAGS
jgi:histidinol-phosphate/aromatic aminotransferase/cobyric acid decarboxylase-like protein